MFEEFCYGFEFCWVCLGVEGKIMSKIKYKFEVDFVDVGVDIIDVYFQ